MITATLLKMKAQAATNRITNGESRHTTIHIISDVMVKVEVSYSGVKIFMTDGYESYLTRNISQASRALQSALA